MSNFREVAHLEEQLGSDRFAFLISSDHTGKVKAFCDRLIRDSFPTRITLGDRTFEVILLRQEGEGRISNIEALNRAIEAGVSIGKENYSYIYEHQGEIPEELNRGVFIFYQEPASEHLPPLITAMSHNGLATWKSGGYGRGDSAGKYPMALRQCH